MSNPSSQVALLSALVLGVNALLVAVPADAVTATVWGQEWQTNSDATVIDSSHIVLTPNAQDQVGSAWVTTSLAVTDISAFSASFEFRISGSDDDWGSGDGMAFVIHGNDADAIGLGGGDLGYGGIGIAPGTDNLLAVEFDTWDCCGDPTAPHVAIHLDGEDVWSGGQAASASSPYSLVRGGVGQTSNLFAWVDFNPGTTTLSVFLSDSNVKPGTALVSFVVGSGLATFIGENIRFGFTAGTGSASSLHEVFDFSTTPVPLPAAAWLLLSGLAGLGFVGRRRTMA